MVLSALKSTLYLLNQILIISSALQSGGSHAPPIASQPTFAIEYNAPIMTTWGAPGYTVVRFTTTFDPNLPISYESFQKYADAVYSDQMRMICTDDQSFNAQETGHIRAYEYVFWHKGRPAIPAMRISPNECSHYLEIISKGHQ